MFKFNKKKFIIYDPIQRGKKRVWQSKLEINDKTLLSM